MTSGKVIYLNTERISTSSGYAIPIYTIKKASELIGQTLEVEVMAATINPVASATTVSITLSMLINTGGVVTTSNFIMSGTTNSWAGVNSVDHASISLAFYASPVAGKVRMYPSESTILGNGSYITNNATTSSLLELDINEDAEIYLNIMGTHSASSMEISLIKAVLINESNVLVKLQEPIVLTTPLSYTFPLITATPIADYAGKAIEVVCCIQGRNASPTGILNLQQHQTLTSTSSVRAILLQQVNVENVVHCRRWHFKINSNGILEVAPYGTVWPALQSFTGSTIQPSAVTATPAEVVNSRLLSAIQSTAEGAEFLVTDYFIKIKE